MLKLGHFKDFASIITKSFTKIMKNPDLNSHFSVTVKDGSSVELCYHTDRSIEHDTYDSYIHLKISELKSNKVEIIMTLSLYRNFEVYKEPHEVRKVVGISDNLLSITKLVTSKELIKYFTI
jgi:hypothetical protein